MIIDLNLFRPSRPDSTDLVHFIHVPDADGEIPDQSYSADSLREAAGFAASVARADNREAVVRVTVGSHDSGRLSRLAAPGEVLAAAVRLLVTYQLLKIMRRTGPGRRYAADRLGRRSPSPFARLDHGVKP